MLKQFNVRASNGTQLSTTIWIDETTILENSGGPYFWLLTYKESLKNYHYDGTQPSTMLGRLDIKDKQQRYC